FFDEDVTPAPGDWRGPVLVVVDCADLRGREVARMLAFATTRDDPTRILLLARTAGTWWTDLQHRFEIAQRTPVDSLEPLLPDVAARQNAFDDAVNDFASELRRVAANGPTNWQQAARAATRPDLTDPEFSSPLNVHLAALAALAAWGVGPDSDRLI